MRDPWGPSSVILVVPVLAYGLGYAYYVGYFGVFGISATAVNLPVERVFVEGALSFLSSLLPEHLEGIAPPSSLIILIVAVFAPTPRLIRVRELVAWLAAVGLLLGGVVSAVGVGRDDGNAMVSNAPVFLRLSQQATGEPAPAATAPVQTQATAWPGQGQDFDRAMLRGNLRQIWLDSNSLIVGEPKTCDSSQSVCYWRVYRLTADSVLAVAHQSPARPRE